MVGRTHFERLELDAATVGASPRSSSRPGQAGRPGPRRSTSSSSAVRPDELDLHVEEVEARARAAFLKVRVRDVSLPALTEGALPSPDTVLGAFIRDLEARIAELEAAARPTRPAELRDALRLGRLLLAGHEVTL